MVETKDIIALVEKYEKEHNELCIKFAMNELANPDGTLANAKFWTGRCAGGQILAATLIANLREYNKNG